MRRAGLAGVQETGVDRALDGGRQVGIVQDHRGGLAAQFQRDPLDGLRGQLGHALAGAGRAGERHHVDLAMAGQHLADHRAVAGHQVEHARRQAGGLDDLGQHEGVQRRHFRRLEHHGAAGGQRRRDLQRDLVQRVVPRRDGGDHADRLAHHQRIADLLLEGEGLDQLGGLAPVEDRATDLDRAGQLDRHADLGRDQLRQLLGARLQALGDLADIVGALLRRRRGPAVEGGTGGLDRVLGIARMALGNPAHHLFGGRVDDVDLPGAVRGHPRAVDKQFVSLLHSHNSSVSRQAYCPSVFPT